ncbi:MAG: 1-deoxy-D-xylulose-5-phosphate reductoisomerase [Alphaproteobacteria bacterium]|nr:1-deoxy-D-xylulose-5-phosphate reductoisomerase [Alphaproteobacteria bacterium]
MNLTILGSTGSIGTSTLEVVARHPERFKVWALTAAKQVDLMLTQCLQFRPRRVVMTQPQAAQELRLRLREHALNDIEVLDGLPALDEVASAPEVDAVMAAIVGAVGLSPCLAAARTGKRLLLANKEALVVGGQLFLDAVRQGGAELLPIDSEHSAVFQSLPPDRDTWSDRVEKIILTASGGPFRTLPPQALQSVTPAQACAHPNWVMGRKISVDSATMMNKALEVIEAHYLFGIAVDHIEVVIHPQSVIHSMVQYRDGSVVAQLGTPDMKVPIAYGLSWPDRIESGAARLDFSAMGDFSFESFESADHQLRYPGLKLAWEALRGISGSTAVLNAVNEVAVEAFLQEQIRFDQIHRVNRETLDLLKWSPPAHLADLLDLDDRARRSARDAVRRLGAG